MISNGNIKCSVENCTYHSKSCDCCSLEQIQVGCSCGTGSVTNCHNTECVSFRPEETGKGIR